jgi:hypothetical protein
MTSRRASACSFDGSNNVVQCASVDDRNVSRTQSIQHAEVPQLGLDQAEVLVEVGATSGRIRLAPIPKLGSVQPKQNVAIRKVHLTRLQAWTVEGNQVAERCPTLVRVHPVIPKRLKGIAVENCEGGTIQSGQGSSPPI